MKIVLSEYEIMDMCTKYIHECVQKYKGKRLSREEIEGWKFIARGSTGVRLEIEYVVEGEE